MDRLDAEINIKEFIQSLTEKNKVPEEIQHLLNQFSLGIDEVFSAWLKWDADIQDYENQSYSSETMRLVMHIHNYLAGSWHIKRQKKS